VDNSCFVSLSEYNPWWAESSSETTVLLSRLKPRPLICILSHARIPW